MLVHTHLYVHVHTHLYVHIQQYVCRISEGSKVFSLPNFKLSTNEFRNFISPKYHPSLPPRKIFLALIPVRS